MTPWLALDAAAMQAQQPRQIPQEGRKVRPRAAILWNGVTIEELGIANLFVSAELTMSIGRTPPSQRHPTGKPKVGSASVTFMLPSEEAGQRLRTLLYFNPRPYLAMGFGYEGLQSHWLAGASVRTRPDMKKFKSLHGHKIDTVSWRYPGDALPTVTLNGMAGRILRLAEQKRASVWTSKTLADIGRGIADEHGVVLRISGSLPAYQRVEHAVKVAGESDLEFLDRVAGMMGGTLHVSTLVASAVPGASAGYAYVFEGRADEGAEDRWVLDQEQVRTVISIKAIEEEFVDLSGLEQTFVPRIAWAPHLSPAKFSYVGGRGQDNWGPYDAPANYVASDVSVTEDNFARAYASSAGVKRNGQSTRSRAEGEAAGELITEPGFFDDALPGAANPATLFHAIFSPGGSDAAVQPQKVETKASTHVMPAMPEELGGRVLSEAQVSASVAAQGIRSRISISLNPGAPEIPCGAVVNLLGTWAHDGKLGVEEVSIKLDADGGCTTTHTCRPVLDTRPGGADRVDAQRGPAVRVASKDKPKPEGIDPLTEPSFRDEKGETLEQPFSAIFGPSDEVRAAPSEAALSSEIDGAEQSQAGVSE